MEQDLYPHWGVSDIWKNELGKIISKTYINKITRIQQKKEKICQVFQARKKKERKEETQITYKS